MSNNELKQTVVAEQPQLISRWRMAFHAVTYLGVGGGAVVAGLETLAHTSKDFGLNAPTVIGMGGVIVGAVFGVGESVVVVGKDREHNQKLDRQQVPEILPTYDFSWITPNHNC